MTESRSIFWKVYLWLLCGVLLFYYLSEGLKTPLDVIDLVVSIPSALGLYLYAYRKKFLNAFAWKFYGIAFIIYEIAHNFWLHRSGDSTISDIVLGAAFFLPMYVALILYAFRFESMNTRLEAVSSPNGGAVSCAACEKEVDPRAPICATCGIPLPRKNKAVAVVLAVFLGHWTWLYTFQKDAGKFWIVLSSWIAFILYSMIAFAEGWLEPSTSVDLGGSLAAILLLSVAGGWVWAIVDSAARKEEWYLSYYLRAMPSSVPPSPVTE